MKLIYIKLLLSVLLFTSCSKELEIPDPEFEVTTESSTYKKGVPVVFKFKGEPKFVSFYSGEVGNDYAFRNGRAGSGPDVSIPIQGGTTLPKKEYIYTFNDAGNYKVYFVAANVTAAGSKEVVKELNLTITD